jgi:hypothetical protein
MGIYIYIYIYIYHQEHYLGTFKLESSIAMSRNPYILEQIRHVYLEHLLFSKLLWTTAEEKTIL